MGDAPQITVGSLPPLPRSPLRWWPRANAAPLVDYEPGFLARTFVVEAAVLGLLSLPPVARVTGLPGPFLLGVLVVHAAAMVLAAGMERLVQRNLAYYHVRLLWVLTYNLGLTLAIIVRTGDPKTPWWNALILYAALSGAVQALDAAWGLVLLFGVVPFVTVPFFVAAGVPIATVLGSACVAGGMAALVYYSIAAAAESWRHVRLQQAQALEAAREHAAGLERDALASDLHDAVGSHLAVVALYGDLIEQQKGDPEAITDLAGTLRAAARDGLSELRAVLNALAPEATTVAGLEAHLRQMAERLQGLGLEARSTRTGPAERPVPPLVRLAMVRAAQEATANALRHGRPTRLALRLQAEQGWLDLLVEDDGCGFRPADAQPGRGLAGLRRRAASLGGHLDVDSQPQRGTRLRLRLPLG